MLGYQYFDLPLGFEFHIAVSWLFYWKSLTTAYILFYSLLLISCEWTITDASKELLQLLGLNK